MKDLQAIPLQEPTNLWITASIMICLGLICLCKVLYEERFLRFLALPIEPRYFIIKKNEHKLSFLFNTLLFTFNCLVAGIVLNLIARDHFPELLTREFVFFIQVVFGFGVLMLVKYFAEKMLANLFLMENIIEDYLFFKFSHRHYLALAIFPLCIIDVYTHVLGGYAFLIISIAFLIINLLFILKYYRKKGLLIFNNLFYFILYLCALEIAPYFILYKVVTILN